tara:strand:- start:44 stop:250 length:207 start_codon:yes stop_codon:yes gene_type:complete
MWVDSMWPESLSEKIVSSFQQVWWGGEGKSVHVCTRESERERERERGACAPLQALLRQAKEEEEEEDA